MSMFISLYLCLCSLVHFSSPVHCLVTSLCWLLLLLHSLVPSLSSPSSSCLPLSIYPCVCLPCPNFPVLLFCCCPFFSLLFFLCWLILSVHCDHDCLPSSPFKIWPYTNVLALTLLTCSLIIAPSASLIFLAHPRICCIHLVTLHKPSPDPETLTFLRNILTSFSIIFMLATLLPAAPTLLPCPFDPVVRHRRCTNAPASYACIHHLSTPPPNRHANGCLLPPYPSHLPCCLIRLFACLLET